MTSMHLNAADLAKLLPGAKGKKREAILKELRNEARWTILRQLPARTGTCGAGYRVIMDEKGAYSSGYLLHTGVEPGGGPARWSTCGHTGPITWDEPGERTRRLRALLEALR